MVKSVAEYFCGLHGDRHLESVYAKTLCFHSSLVKGRPTGAEMKYENLQYERDKVHGVL